MPRWAAKADDNQPAMVAALRAVGFTVQHLHTIGKGCPDLLVGAFAVNILVEVKMPGEDLTDDEKAFFDSWGGQRMSATEPSQVINEFYSLVVYGQPGALLWRLNKTQIANAVYAREMAKLTTPKRAYTRKARGTR